MLTFTSIYRVFNFFGVLQAVYSTKNRKFSLFKPLVPYSVCIFLLTEGYIIIEGRVNTFEVTKATFARETRAQDSWVITLALLVDFTSYVILNASTFMTILHKRDAHCELLNQLLVIDENPIFRVGMEREQSTVKYRVQAVYYSFAIMHFIAYPVYRYVHFGFSWLALARLISVNFHTLQFEFGNLYELIVMEKLSVNFKILRKHIGDKHVVRVDVALRRCISQYEHLWKLSKFATELFAFHKIFCLTCVNLLISLYFFYDYDRMDIYSGWSLLRQTLLYFIFVICNHWHRLMEQVLDACYFSN